jgi:hypothetical protein
MAEIAVANGGFTPQIWSDKININLDNYGAYNDIVNRKYEGEIKRKGDVVKFYTYGSLTVKDYNPTAGGFTGLEFEDPKGQLTELNVNQQKYIAFQVDDIEKVQSNVELVNGFTKRMAIAFAQTKDLFIHGLAVAGAGTKLEAKAITKDNIWEVVCEMYANLARKNAIVDGVDYSGKRPALVITPETEGILKQAPQYFANAFGNEVLRKGQIGHIGGFDVFVDTNIEAKGEIVALTSDAIMFAEQITETDTVKAENSFHHKVKSLHVYGGVVGNADCIVTQAVA